MRFLLLFAEEVVRSAAKTVVILFGTRPEVIKLAPILEALSDHRQAVRALVVCSGQHTDLVRPFIDLFRIAVDHDLNVMQPGQTPAQVLARALSALDPLLARERPELVLVQGDTTTALAGALAGFQRQIPVAHVEAGLRSGDSSSPFPEEMNRRLITRLARYHFAATEDNRATLLAEGVPAEAIFLTGNPVVDALHTILRRETRSPLLREILEQSRPYKRLVLTTHRRENLGAPMHENLRQVRRFVETHPDVMVLFPVHLNPGVRGPAKDILSDHPRILLLPPLEYGDFIPLLANAWLIVSDSGGVQEEAPTLGTPLLVLRRTTERPEAVRCGIARLVGDHPEALGALLEEHYRSDPGKVQGQPGVNPFGQGDSAVRIVAALQSILHAHA